MSIGVVFDTSALLAHVRLERLSAGELVGEVADNGDLVGVPALAVLDALAQLKQDDRARLERLVDGDSHTVVVLPLTSADVLEVHRVASLIAGGWGAAQAVVAANRHEVLLATTAPADLGIGVVIHADDVDVLS
ncbi:hypothetical protein Cs7R123_54990 [Catellatospora sp. TT07R-123]|uniref:hypothetical protein n=1 Tax=Catellatospora sp. TT07R-123 TaxID=2733863 RepID=UPI001B0481AA|nr:hypothetical protein [Catellatospora sp. TT07R-123]GHJ48157.1 hypothetical protein Cs7R123_54990 [Catellatospora sp. TT07R-123]